MKKFKELQLKANENEEKYLRLYVNSKIIKDEFRKKMKQIKLINLNVF